MTTEAEQYAARLLKKYDLPELDVSLSDDKYKTTGDVVKAILPKELWYDWLQKEVIERNQTIQLRNLDLPLSNIDKEYAKFVGTSWSG